MKFNFALRLFFVFFLFSFTKTSLRRRAGVVRTFVYTVVRSVHTEITRRQARARSSVAITSGMWRMSGSWIGVRSIIIFACSALLNSTSSTIPPPLTGSCGRNVINLIRLWSEHYVYSVIRPSDLSKTFLFTCCPFWHPISTLSYRRETPRQK